MFGFDRWSVLAVLRFVLASIVAVQHLVDHAALGWLAWIPELGAFEAVLGFLLISGYSIGCSYQQRPDGFLVRRMARIYPIYLAAIVLSFIATPQHLSAALLGILLLNVLFLNQLFTSVSFVGPAWSLSLEFWLYCLAPRLSRMSPRALKWLIIGSFTVYAAYTCGRTVFHLPYYSGLGFGVNLLALSFMWLCGLRLALEPTNQRRILRGIALLSAAHIALTIAIQFVYRLKHHAVTSFVGEDAPGLAARCLTLFVVWLTFKVLLTSRSGGRQRSSVMRMLGDTSYPLYLIHVPAYVLLKRAGIHYAPVLFGGAIASAYLVYASLDFYSKRRDRQKPAMHPELEPTPSSAVLPH